MALHVVGGHFIIAYISHARACDRDVRLIRSLRSILCIKITSGERGICVRSLTVLLIVCHILNTW